MADTAGPPGQAHRPSQVLVVEDDTVLRNVLAHTLTGKGIDVVTAEDGHEALRLLSQSTPDLVITDIQMPGMDGLTLLRTLRNDPNQRDIPVIVCSALDSMDDVIDGLSLGADDYITKPFHIPELLARVQTKLDRPPVATHHIVSDRQTGLLNEAAFTSELGRELNRSRRSGRGAILACIETAELPGLKDKLGSRAEAEIATQMTTLIGATTRALDISGRDNAGRFLILLAESDQHTSEQTLATLGRLIVDFPFRVGDERIRLTPTIGFALSEGTVDAAELKRRAVLAAGDAGGRLDLVASRYSPEMEAQAATTATAAPLINFARWRDPVQVVITLIVGLALPLLGYIWADSIGLDVAPVMYLVVVASLLFTALAIWIEGFLALRTVTPPDANGPEPPATAIIAAYLPNEAATIEKTVEAFLAVDYPDLQIILAYNTPRPLPVEQQLGAIAKRDPRFVAYKVEGSTSKAQNVNAALAITTGEFLGIFDADHHPEPTNFSRAWQWLSNGAGVVQGHCVVRNGEASWVAAMVAVEFEQIYAVSHPGRARMHDFGIFGGSNGYWRTDALRRIRMRGAMLTEDIDSSMRALEEGETIISDPGLMSKELAPTSLGSLWNQRMRWAQGWFQVALTHRPLYRSDRLSLRNKVGLAYLLTWREIYPWISLQMLPIIAFFAWKYGGVDKLDWLIPLFVITTVFTLGTGPAQAFFAYRVGAPEIRQHRRWFWFYLVISTVFYTEMKNTIARVAQLKQLLGEKAWKVTPREGAQ